MTPGTVFDKKGYPIYPGDIVKTFHFRGARNKLYYLYHMVIQEAGTDKMFVAHFSYKNGVAEIIRQTTITSLGWYDQATGRLEKTEIIQGFGPGKLVCFEDRPRNKNG